MGWRKLSQAYGHLRERYANAWIGVNFPDLEPEEAFQKAPDGVSGLWVDNAGSGDARKGNFYAERIAPFRETRPELLYFGGVAFKYQNRVEDFGEAARGALPFVDVVTTSGNGIGEAPDVEKKLRR